MSDNGVTVSASTLQDRMKWKSSLSLLVAPCAGHSVVTGSGQNFGLTSENKHMTSVLTATQGRRDEWQTLKLSDFYLLF